MSLAAELASLLPPELPNRPAVISASALHLEWIALANEQFNLTRITGERDAAIKHVLDSVLAWRHFAGAKTVLDAGTGAGYPGIPLALVLPEVHFTLAESTGKKARFVADAVERLHLKNVVVAPVRAEDWLKANRAECITGRALAPLERACSLFGAAVRRGARGIFYKGPDAETEIAAAAAEARKQKVQILLIDRFELPDGLGTRTLVEIKAP